MKHKKRNVSSLFFALFALCAALAPVFFSLHGGRFMGWFLGIGALAALIYAVLLRLSARWRPARVAARVEAVLFFVFLASFIVVQALILSGGRASKDTTADAAVVFGAGLEGEAPSLSLLSRLRAAETWLSENPQASAVLTGGQGPGERITEAEGMRRWLEGRGIAPGRLILEEQAVDTDQNVAFSCALLKQNGILPGSRIAVVSNEFHLYRIGRLMARAGYETMAVPAETPLFYLKVTYFVREYVSVIFMWLGL